MKEKVMRKYRKVKNKKKKLCIAILVITAVIISIIYTTPKDICLVFFP